MRRTRNQNGGSVASNAVTSLVNADTYNQMNKIFSNQVGEQCGGKCKKCGRYKRGGGLGDMVKQVTNSATAALGLKSHYTNSTFQSSPALAYNAVLPRNVGITLSEKSQFVNSGKANAVMANVAKLTSTNATAVNAKAANATAVNAKAANATVVNAKAANATVVNAKAANATAVNAKVVQGEKLQYTDLITPPKLGGNKKQKGGMQTMTQLMASNSDLSSYAIRNKKGGANSNVGLNYNAIKSSGLPNGPHIDRAQNDLSNRLLATEAVPAMKAIQKFTQYGSPLDTKLPFAYSSERLSVPPSGGSMRRHVKKAVKVIKSRIKAKTSKRT